MSQDKATRESIAKQISIEFGIAYSTVYKKIDKILEENNTGIRLHQRSVWNLTQLLSKLIDNYSDLLAQERYRRIYYENRFSADLVRNRFSKILSIR